MRTKSVSTNPKLLGLDFSRLDCSRGKVDCKDSLLATRRYCHYDCSCDYPCILHLQHINKAIYILLGLCALLSQATWFVSRFSSFWIFYFIDRCDKKHLVSGLFQVYQYLSCSSFCVYSSDGELVCCNLCNYNPSHALLGNCNFFYFFWSGTAA